MRILVAPDKFRGTLSAPQAAEAIATGWRRARPGDTIDICPIADGGEGTTLALVAALRGRMIAHRVRGPLDDEVEASFGIARRAVERVAIVESAAASGLALIAESRRNPVRASTVGTGELIAAALGEEPDRLLLCVGGTATNDGGAGMAQALGARLMKADGGSIRAGGGALIELAAIDLSAMDPRLPHVDIEVCADVDHPLTGPSGASATFGPQKGASPDDVLVLDRALGHLAAIVYRDLGIDLRAAPGAGAGGGLGFGAMAFLGARVRRGADLVADVVGLGRRVAGAGLVVTGEGRFDGSSLRGKAPQGVLRLAREQAVEAVVVCGEKEAGIESRIPGHVTVVALVDRFGRRPALEDARRSVESLAEEIAAGVDRPKEDGER